MNPPTAGQAEWHDLFRSEDSTTGRRVRFRLLRKRGEPLLILPESPRAAIQALALYPAQSRKARLMKWILLWSLKLQLPLPGEGVDLLVAPCPFERFLGEQAKTGNSPTLGILCGNPRTGGRRFLLLVFGERDEPRCVVKAGVGETAIKLIERENDFLGKIPQSVAGIPKTLGTIRDENLSAFAMEFLVGESPSADDETLVERILTGWIGDGTVPLSDVPAWRQLETIATHLPSFGKVNQSVVRRVIAHGDFTPWNMKVNRQSGRCVVFDWERGQFPGVPGWDWFHFVLQTNVLVKKLPVNALRNELERLLASERFCGYAEKCRVSHFKKTLAAMYLLYVEQIIQPSEGGDKISALLQLLLTEWKSDLKS